MEEIDFMDETTEIFFDDRPESIREIQRHYEDVLRLSKLAEAMVITNDESNGEAINLEVRAKDVHRKIEMDRKMLTEPMRMEIQSINDCAKNLQLSLDNITGTLKIKIASYQLEQSEKTKEAQREVQKLSKTLGLDIDILVPQVKKSYSTDKAITYFKEKKGFEIQDLNAIPDEYWVVDEKLIQKHIDLGKTDIPGIKIKTEKTFHIRRK